MIDACCELQWPRDRLLVQVLDDSTDAITRERIEDKVAEWRAAGHLFRILLPAALAAAGGGGRSVDCS